MSITFNGVTLTVGAPFYDNKSVGHVGGLPCDVAKQGGFGVALDPFWFEIPCDCQPAAGDTIEMSATTILLIDVTTITWDLCGHECKGHSTSPGVSLGLEHKKLKWVVR
jgi:hypothetical protein